jgi:hypothetical protein
MRFVSEFQLGYDALSRRPSGLPNHCWSPDGNRLAYRSQHDVAHVYQKRLGVGQGEPLDTEMRDKRPTDWSRDGQFTVDIQRGPGREADFHPGVPKPLFDVRIGNDQRYDVSKDGRFLIPSALGEQVGNVPLTVVLNWPAALKK